MSRHASTPDPSGSRTSMTTRSGRKRRVERLGDRAGFGDHLEARPPVEHGGQALPDDLVVVDDEDRQRLRGCLGALAHDSDLLSGPVVAWFGSLTRTVVPVAGSLSMDIVAPMPSARSRMLTRP